MFGLFPVLGYFELSCYKYSCASLCGHRLSFLLVKDLEVELLDHGVGIFSKVVGFILKSILLLFLKNVSCYSLAFDNFFLPQALKASVIRNTKKFGGLFHDKT